MEFADVTNSNHMHAVHTPLLVYVRCSASESTSRALRPTQRLLPPQPHCARGAAAPPDDRRRYDRDARARAEGHECLLRIRGASRGKRLVCPTVSQPTVRRTIVPQPNVRNLRRTVRCLRRTVRYFRPPLQYLRPTLWHPTIRQPAVRCLRAAAEPPLPRAEQPRERRPRELKSAIYGGKLGHPQPCTLCGDPLAPRLQKKEKGSDVWGEWVVT